MNPLLMKHTLIYRNIQRTRAHAIVTCVHTFGGIVAQALVSSAKFLQTEPVLPQILLPLSGSSIFQPKMPTPGCCCERVYVPWGDWWVTCVQRVFLPLWWLGPCLTGDIQVDRWADGQILSAQHFHYHPTLHRYVNTLFIIGVSGLNCFYR